VIKNRLPKTYPRPNLIFFENEEYLHDIYNIKCKEDEELRALYDGTEHTICIAFDNVLKKDTEIVAKTLLHECAHAYFLQKYGRRSKQYSDELACDRFANKWYKVLISENLL